MDDRFNPFRFPPDCRTIALLVVDIVDSTPTIFNFAIARRD
jgi:hypothetical protein